MNKQQLASKIWKGANDLRGKIAAAKYKDYMLGFMFYKYLSEKETEYLKNKLYFEEADFEELTENDTATVENCQRNIGYFISHDNLFSTWISKGQDFSVANVRDALNAFNRLIGPNYKNTFNNIFKAYLIYPKKIAPKTSMQQALQQQKESENKLNDQQESRVNFAINSGTSLKYDRENNDNMAM